MQPPIKIAFFGTSDFAVPALKSLVNFGYDVIAVITQPGKPTGRLKLIVPSPVKKAALELNLPVFEPHNLKADEEFLKHFHKLNPDLAIVASYGKILPEKLLQIPKHGFINIHPSLLPKYRGPSPIQTAIMNDDHETGVAIMIVDKEVDHGAILNSLKLKMQSEKYYKEIREELAKIGAELLIDIIPKYISGEIKPQEQDHSKATFTKILSREDGKINWNLPAEDIYNQIRALSLEPGTWTTYKDKVLNIKLAEIQCLPQKGQIGIVEKLNNQIAVGTQKCYLTLKQIQLEGGKEMDAKSFLNGHPDFLGSKLE